MQKAEGSISAELTERICLVFFSCSVRSSSGVPNERSVFYVITEFQLRRMAFDAVNVSKCQQWKQLNRRFLQSEVIKVRIIRHSLLFMKNSVHFITLCFHFRNSGKDVYSIASLSCSKINAPLFTISPYHSALSTCARTGVTLYFFRMPPFVFTSIVNH